MQMEQLHDGDQRRRTAADAVEDGHELWHGGHLHEAGHGHRDGRAVPGLHNVWITLNNPAELNSYTTSTAKEVILAMRQASKFFRDNGYQSRPTQVHGIDLVTDKPHVVAEHVSAEKFEEVLKPGMVIMAEPNPITADGLFGIFLDHTFIVTESGHEVVDKFPLKIAVAG